MQRSAQRVFLCLILAQALHSIEECVTKLYAVFAPARLVASLVSHDLGLGFAVANAVLVSIGVWCWAVPVRLGWRTARGIIWIWTIVELVNGINHSTVALLRGGYFPGVATAPLLLFFAGWLVVIQVRERPGHASDSKASVA